MMVFRKKTNDGRTTWIVQRNEKKIMFSKTNEKNKPKQTIFSDKLLKLNERFYRTNDFTERTILLTDRQLR